MDKTELNQLVDQSLKSEPSWQLPDNFAMKVSQLIARKEQWKADFREYLLLAAVALGLIILTAGFYFFVDKQTTLMVYHFITANWLTFALIAFLVNFILFADRVLLRLLFNRWSKG